ncbi:gluconolactonase [Hoeflea sp. IMCC20628]|uniref:SMP-30/gluconolactonase/LRE family protein n=1 Tax=Hoeflea sp. IMCC20628 TaxID=1620421 RepID=UPI00063BE418|nr:SMP-30/gluconolactonase/LRE family protein [Hoeflea sp. IMCC20628]AKH99697.1 gluconolactonase [Hoeflea sp. IMCC20628]
MGDISEPHGSTPEDISVWKTGAEVTECPYWDHQTGSLFFVDIRKPALHQYSAEGAAMRSWPLPEPVGAFTLLESGAQAIVGLKSGLARLDLESGVLERLLDPEPDLPINRLNEGKVSPCGKWFLFGSMDESGTNKPTGSIYAMSMTGELHKLVEGLVVANGLAWSVDGSTLYYSDSWASTIWQCDWNADIGKISSVRIFAEIAKQDGAPDGAAMDQEGCYWSAGVSAGCLNRFAPDGTLKSKIRLPVQAPTMPAFGPPESETMYVTSHRRIQNPTDMDGGIVTFPVPASGVAVPRFKMSTCDAGESNSPSPA